MNHLQRLLELRNQYYAFRHGKSKANQQGIIVSHPFVGCLEEFSLAREGELQVRQSVTKAESMYLLSCNVIIITSPFSRARASAFIAQEVLSLVEPIRTIIDERLRERWFGTYDKKSSTLYETVWRLDRHDPTHSKNGVESAVEVQRRTTQLVVELEERYLGKNILLASHGDALQILQTGFAKVSPALHRELPHLELAEIRPLLLAKRGNL